MTEQDYWEAQAVDELTKGELTLKVQELEARVLQLEEMVEAITERWRR